MASFVQRVMRRRTVAGAALLTVAAVLGACAPHTPEAEPSASLPVTVVTGPAGGMVHVVAETTIVATFSASGSAHPIQQATLSTPLMGTVTTVLVNEGDVVSAGQPLVRLDARDLVAREAQVAASVASAEAMHRDATAQAIRIRALYADSAATRSNLEQAENSLARAEAAVLSARAAAQELSATFSYATIRAPFAGVITRRHVDPGSFAAPGSPLVSLQDPSRLRITVTAAPDAVRGVARGQPIAAFVEGAAVSAIVEGVVPASGGNLYSVNAIVANPVTPRGTRALLPGSTATLNLPLGPRVILAVPSHAILREGDLTGVMLRTERGDERRWVRLGAPSGDVVEVVSGLRAGDRVIVPASGPSARRGTASVERPGSES